MTSARSTRVLRGLAAAAFSTFVALFSHVMAGGSMPGWLGIAVPAVFSAFICVLLAGRRLSLFRLSLSVAASQFLFHTLFMLGAAPRATPTPPLSPHAMHGAPATFENALMPIAHGSHSGAEMWFAHAIAAIFTVAVLHHTDVLLTAISAVKEFVLKRLSPATPAFLTAPVTVAQLFVRGTIPMLSSLSVYPSTTALRGPPTLSFI